MQPRADARGRFMTTEKFDSRKLPGRQCVRATGLEPSLLLSFILLLFNCGCSRDESGSNAVRAPKPTTIASPATTFDLDGHAVDPFAAAEAKAIVFVFLSTDCPISNRYAPEIRRVEENATRSGIKFWLVYADADATPESIRKHISDYRLPQHALRDPRHALVRLAQARVTPEAAVFLPGAKLVYHGRIDNRYADLGKERPEATQHDLEEVLTAILQGRPVPYSAAKAVGCYISDPK